MNMFANSKDYWKARCENAEDQLTRLKNETEKLVSYIQNGIECFANPCLDHSRVNTPPFSEFQERYGSLCLMCVVDELEARKGENKEFRKISADRSETIDRLIADGAELEEENERLKTRVAELVDATTKVRYIDGLGAARISPADCRDGISYVTVADTVYWPLSADDAQLLRAAGCGMGYFTGPSHRPITALSVPDEEVAKMFHENYEKLAPSFGYETREETRKSWEEVPPNNKALMIAVIKQIRLTLLTPSHNVSIGVSNGHGI